MDDNEDDTVDDHVALFTQESEEPIGSEIDTTNDSSKSKNDTNEDDDGGEDESSIGSSSSSQSNSSISSTDSVVSEASLTLMQRQARNIARNQRFLGSLREKYKDRLGTPQQPKRKGSTVTKDRGNNDVVSDDEEDYYYRNEESLGMIRKGTHRLFQFSPAIGKLGKDTKEKFNNESDENNNLQKHDVFLRSHRNLSIGLQALEDRYPHRSVQIGRLYALLSSTISLTATIPPLIRSSSAASVYVPAPIFCMGSKGTGKTSIVCDVVGLLSSQGTVSPSTQLVAKVQPAYIDCSIVEPSTVDRLVYTIYQQLKPSSSLVLEEKETTSGNKTKINVKRSHRRKRKRHTPTTSDANSHAQDGAGDQDDNDTNHLSSTSKPQQQQNTECEDDDTNQPRVLPSRRAKKAAIHKSIASNATTYQNVKKNRMEGGNNRADDTGDGSDTDEDEGDSDEEGVGTLHSAVLNLGRSLQKHYGAHLDDNGAILNRSFCRKPRCGILILDRAEELLSLSSASKKGTSSSGGGRRGANNYLSELLLLPKIMKLNITVVVITSYCTLHMTRLNNAADPSKALGTISNGVHPIIVQFPAYKGNKVFCEILSTVENRSIVMGDSLSPTVGASAMRQTLKDKLVESFWSTLVQFLSDSTFDVRDFQRIGRALWPSFVAPLHPSVLGATLRGAAKQLGFGGGLTRRLLSDPHKYSRLETEVVRILGTNFYSRVASLASGDENLTLMIFSEDGVIPVEQSSSSSGETDGERSRILPVYHDLGVCHAFPQPFLRSILLLAAFVCQHNKADRDLKLFSIHGNGRRKKSRARDDIYGGNDEDVAFGSTSVRTGATVQKAHLVEELRSLQRRPIPLERVFSIFVTLFRLNPNQTLLFGGSGGGGGGSGNVGESASEEAELEAAMEDLGSSRLYTDLNHLIELGYLRVAKGNQQLDHLAPPRVLCTLTREEAVEISNRIGIPLETYLI